MTMVFNIQFAHWFILCSLSLSRVFLGSRISIFYGFSDLPRVPAPLCDHGLLRQKVNVRTTKTDNIFPFDL